MSESGILIRKAATTDKDQVLGLWMLLMEEQSAIDARFTISGDAHIRWKNDYSDWIYSEEYRILVAESEGRLVGFASAQLWSPPPIHQASMEVYLNEIFCAEAYRNRGLGSKLLEGMEMWCRELGVGRLRFGVLSRNERAADFWRRHGAEPFAVTFTKDVR